MAPNKSASKRKYSIFLLRECIENQEWEESAIKYIKNLSRLDIEKLFVFFGQNCFLKDDNLEKQRQAVSFMRKLLYMAGYKKVTPLTEVIIIKKHLSFGRTEAGTKFLLSVIEKEGMHWPRENVELIITFTRTTYFDQENKASILEALRKI